jgi:hypothetical protein
MPAGSEARSSRARDPRLDFFRGLGMCIILVAHIPWNPWTNWIPARFGFSDAADMFVFCSGMASALAFGRVYRRDGWSAGTLRILRRMGQVHAAHVLVFVTVLLIALWLDQTLGVDHYVREELNLQPVVDRPVEHFLDLVTLRYVPNYFDILPMYCVVLAMVPVMVALAGRHVAWAAALSVALWIGAQLGWLSLTADAETGRTWFFNPFAWQLLFFTGFAFGAGWIAAPRPDGRLVAAAILIVLVGVPLGCQAEFPCYAGFGHVPLLGEIHDGLGPFISKPDLGALRYAHFLATAYLAVLAAGEAGRRLTGPASKAMRMIGRQTLAVFLAGLVAAQLLGAALDVLGRSAGIVAAVNLAGLGLLLAVAGLRTQVRRRGEMSAPRRVADGGHPDPARTPVAAQNGRLGA